MVVIDLLVTFVLAFVIAAVFVTLLGWRRTGEDALWPALLFFFLIV